MTWNASRSRSVAVKKAISGRGARASLLTGKTMQVDPNAFNCLMTRVPAPSKKAACVMICGPSNPRATLSSRLQ